MQFEVNGQNYFLQFSSEEGKWFLLRSKQDGIELMKISDDAEGSLGEMLVPFDTDTQSTVN